MNVANIAGIADYHYGMFTLGPTFVKDLAQQLYVNADAYPDLDSFIEAAKAAPGQLRVCTEAGLIRIMSLRLLHRRRGLMWPWWMWDRIRIRLSPYYLGR